MWRRAETIDTVTPKGNHCGRGEKVVEQIPIVPLCGDVLSVNKGGKAVCVIVL